MSTDAVEKFRARAKELDESLGRKRSSAEIEREVNERAERAAKQREEAKGRPPKEKQQAEDRVTIVDRYGNRSEFKESDLPKL